MITAEVPQVSQTARYSVTEAAEKLGVHRVTVRRWIDASELKCHYRRNGRAFVEGSEILRFWKSQLA